MDWKLGEPRGLCEDAETRRESQPGRTSQVLPGLGLYPRSKQQGMETPPWLCSLGAWPLREWMGVRGTVALRGRLGTSVQIDMVAAETIMPVVGNGRVPRRLQR